MHDLGYQWCFHAKVQTYEVFLDLETCPWHHLANQNIVVGIDYNFRNHHTSYKIIPVFTSFLLDSKSTINYSIRDPRLELISDPLLPGYYFI